MLDSQINSNNQSWKFVKDEPIENMLKELIGIEINDEIVNLMDNIRLVEMVIDEGNISDLTSDCLMEQRNSDIDDLRSMIGQQLSIPTDYQRNFDLKEWFS
tara:strand:- start:57 stop:359 length:303 start_codon:yes stop_codon:yes gene_type:complete